VSAPSDRADGHGAGSAPRPSPPTGTRFTRSCPTRIIAALPGPTGTSRRTTPRARRRLLADRSHGGKRRTSGRNEATGPTGTARVLGFSRYMQLRRQGHFDRVQRPDVHRDVRRFVPRSSFAPCNERAPGRKKSQIDEYARLLTRAGRGSTLDAADHDIVSTVTSLRRTALEFLTVPGSYYDELATRGGPDRRGHRHRSAARAAGRPRRGRLLLQLFTKPVEDRPRCSSRSSSAKAAGASARATSRRCSNPSSVNRRSGKSIGDGIPSLRDSAAGPSKRAAQSGDTCRVYHALDRFRGSGTSSTGRRTAACTPKS